MTGRSASRPAPVSTAIISNSRSLLPWRRTVPIVTVNYSARRSSCAAPGDGRFRQCPPGQFTLPLTVLQRAQMAQIGAHHGRHRLTFAEGGVRHAWRMTGNESRGSVIRSYLRQPAQPRGRACDRDAPQRAGHGGWDRPFPGRGEGLCVSDAVVSRVVQVSRRRTRANGVIVPIHPAAGRRRAGP